VIDDISASGKVIGHPIPNITINVNTLRPNLNLIYGLTLKSVRIGIVCVMPAQYPADIMAYGNIPYIYPFLYIFIQFV